MCWAQGHIGQNGFYRMHSLRWHEGCRSGEKMLEREMAETTSHVFANEWDSLFAPNKHRVKMERENKLLKVLKLKLIMIALIAHMFSSYAGSQAKQPIRYCARTHTPTALKKTSANSVFDYDVSESRRLRPKRSQTKPSCCSSTQIKPDKRAATASEWHTPWKWPTHNYRSHLNCPRVCSLVIQRMFV